MLKTRLVRRIFKTCGILAALGVLAVVALLGVLWLERSSAITLPAPTGPFAVGRAIYAWADREHTDPLAPVPGTKRELLVWIWYPAAEQSGLVVDDYVPTQLREPPELAGGTLIRLVTRDVSKVHGHSFREPDVSMQEPVYPVVIMRGGGSAPVVGYSTLAEDLASHGYVVVGFDAPYRTRLVVFPDGRVIARTPENNPELVSGEALERRAEKLLDAWAADVGFVLDRLEHLNRPDSSSKFSGRLDMARVGVFGHSFGGATAAQCCASDAANEVRIALSEQ